MRQILKDFCRSQWVSGRDTAPMHRFDSYKRIFHIISPAGVVKWRAREKDPDKFRNRYINEIDQLAKKKEMGKDITRESFDLYRRMRKEFRVSYSANARTRLRGVGEWILSALKSQIS